MILIVKLLKELLCPWGSLKVQYLCNLCHLRKAVMPQEHPCTVPASSQGQQIQHHCVNSVSHEAERWGQNRVNKCLICHWDLVVGRTRRADPWTRELLLLPWAAPLGVDYSTAKRSWPKLKTKGEPWTWGCSSCIYSGDTGMEEGETGFGCRGQRRNPSKRDCSFTWAAPAPKPPAGSPAKPSWGKDLEADHSPHPSAQIPRPFSIHGTMEAATVNHRAKSTEGWRGNEKIWL